jgi:hypothetical protein
MIGITHDKTGATRCTDGSHWNCLTQRGDSRVDSFSLLLASSDVPCISHFGESSYALSFADLEAYQNPRVVYHIRHGATLGPLMTSEERNGDMKATCRLQINEFSE